MIVSALGCVFCGRHQSRSPAHPPTERLNTLIAKHLALTHDDNRDLQRMHDQEVLGMALRVACTDGGARRFVLAFHFSQFLIRSRAAARQRVRLVGGIRAA